MADVVGKGKGLDTLRRRNEGRTDIRAHQEEPYSQFK